MLITRFIGRFAHHIAGLWTEVCVAWPVLDMIDAGYNVDIVEDACGAPPQRAHDAAIRPSFQAGAVPMTPWPPCSNSKGIGRTGTTTMP